MIMESTVEVPNEVEEKLLLVFNDIDTDKSGSISIQEFRNACEKLSLQVSPDDIKEFLSSDTSGDDALDFKEFSIFYVKRLKKVFDVLDNDRSGEISVDELQHAFNKLGYKATIREVNLLLSQVDADKNGLVNFNEFCFYFSSVPSPDVRTILEQWASGLSVDVGTDLVPPPLPPPSVPIWQALFAGGVAGVVSRTLTAPLETVKLLAQTSTTGAVQIIPTIRELLTTHKWKRLFAGNGTNCLRILPFSALVCLAYSNLSKHFPLDGMNSQWAGVGRMCAGATAGIFATTITHPIDVVRAKLTVQSSAAMTGPQYKGLFHGLNTIFKQEGVKGLYKGIKPTLFAIAPFMAIQQSTYDVLKHWSAQYGLVSSPLLFLTCGSIAGATAQTAIYPFDVIRRRMQVFDQRDALSILRSLGTQRKLFAGITATYLKVMPSAAISLLVRDALLGRLENK